MTNRHRGEIDAELGGRTYTLCLTLGALAELESRFGDADMLALATRFESGRLSARDVLHVLAAGLRGAGNDISDDDVARMNCPGGAAGYVAVVARLLEATFGGPDEGTTSRSAASASSATAQSASAPGGAAPPAPDPFPGMG